MIEKFIQENIIRDIENYESLEDLYARYLSFCEFNKIENLTSTKFHNQLKKSNVGITDERRRKNRENKIYRWGVRLSPCKY